MRTKGEPGTGNIVEAVRHMRAMNQDIAKITYFYNQQDKQELFRISKELNTSYELVVETGRLGRLPVVNFAAGGITTPADAAFMMKLGCDGVFVGSGIYKSSDPLERALAIVLATTFHDKVEVVAEAQEMIDEKKSMVGLGDNLDFKMQDRGV